MLRPTLSALSCGVALGLFASAAITIPARGEDRREADRDHPAERAEWNAMLRRDRDGHVLAQNRLRALDATCQMPVDPLMAQAPAGSFTRSAVGPSVRASYTFSGTAWQSLGPQPMQSLSYGRWNWGVVAGRVDAIAIHPTNPSIMLLGAATGGIWKSTDAGASWRPVSDTAAALAISHIAFSLSNPSIVFAATGETDNAFMEGYPSESLGTYLGGGLLKSVDSGDSWTRVDVNLPPNAIISRVVVQPNNPMLVVVGIYYYQDVGQNKFYVGGVWRSTDGGVHFTQTFWEGSVSDLAQDPGNSLRLFMTTGICNGCSSYGGFISSDFGATWQPALTTTAELGNIKIGVSKTNPLVLYSSVLASDFTHASDGGGIYKSMDGGATWQPVAFDPSMCPTKAFGGNNQCSYDHWIAPDPLNPSTVYFGSVDLYKSTDGGATWSNILKVYADTGPTATTHPDQHTAVFSPTGTLFIGNDGGVYRSDNGGFSFQSLNATLSLAQFNGVALHPTNTAFAMGGTQDNGNQRYTGSATWSDRTGGDGGFSLIRRDAPAQILSGYVYQGMNFSSNGGQTFSFFSDCDNGSGDTSISCSDAVGFYPPAVSPTGQPGTVLLGTNRIWANSTFGQNPLAWFARSPSKITNSHFTTVDAPGGDPGPVWAGTVTGSVFFSIDGGATFATRFTGLPAAPVTRIVSVTSDGRSAYASFGGYLALPSKHVFRTTDAGVTWTNISNNLPDVPILDLKVDPTDPNDIFLGSDVGVFRSTNGGASWATFNAGLPNVPVYGLAFHPVTNDLWAATYGRGVWRVTNPVSAGPVANFSFSPPLPSTGQSVQFTDASTGGPTSWSWGFGDAGVSTSQNPTHTFATAGSFPVSLTVSNSGGSNTATKTVTVTPAGSSSCVEDATTMCLVSGRYQIRSHWKNQYAGGAMSTLSKAKLTDATGAFWIANSATYEYLIRFNTATSNGRIWIVVATFTDVEFWVDVTDTHTGQSNEYHSEAGNRTLLYDPYTFVYP